MIKNFNDVISLHSKECSEAIEAIKDFKNKIESLEDFVKSRESFLKNCANFSEEEKEKRVKLFQRNLNS